ncbi:homoserine kinase [Cytobacillus oceanisediminis]|jgi:homoserine kinase|uniref:Homoserine kinase n=2 Tax=Niallia TaxID=2837506 RepID=A0A941GE95_NIACI|nr:MULTISPECIES: homoserine kinase [Bacillaceae]EOR24226.1 homoserine kinase [Niallia nealsonii AAU1]MBQ6446741.1 homoserine kinase [Bacillus sp. (in: firmicutes)]MDU1848311.1 homoserine kinase [Niallia nealsonii]MBZ9533956.1 homoserine kinase [Cytobacillus oceanisediminis]MCB5235996.1 homoserine kinase [Niallia circulans]
MNEGEMLLIKVPASTANLGPGFDSIGLALNLYLTLEVARSECWEVIPLTEELKEFPNDESNFIIRTAIEVAKTFETILAPCQIKVDSNIPLARGLGSSASAIVAGIELADQVGNLQLTKQQKFEIASKMEGHPDNVGASIFGGLVIGCQIGEEVDAEIIHSIDLDVLAVIPEEELLTKSSRGVLPSSLSFGEAVSAGAVSNLLVAALLTGNLKLAGKMMKQDKYHQPYRKELVPHLQIMEEQAYKLGAYGVALSGAGPTVLCFVKPGEMDSLMEGLTAILPEMCFLPLEIDKEGSICSGAIATEIK